MNYTSQQPHEIDIITPPILWMKKLRPRGSNLTKVLEIDNTQIYKLPNRYLIMKALPKNGKALQSISIQDSSTNSCNQRIFQSELVTCLNHGLIPDLAYSINRVAACVFCCCIR